MKKIILAILTAGAGIVAFAPASNATPQEKVTICHRTNSDTNPYVLITVNGNAVDGEGKNDHTHHVVDDNHERGDIIPAPESDEVPFCPGPDPVPGPEGPQGPQGPAGNNGEDGEDGLTPTILCFPGAGLGYTFNPEGQLPDGSFILAEGAICPLVGADGADGPQGPIGLTGPQGPAGANGAVGATGPAGTAGSTIVVESAPVAPPAAPQPTALPRTGVGTGLGMFAAMAILLGGIFTLVSRMIKRQSA